MTLQLNSNHQRMQPRNCATEKVKYNPNSLNEASTVVSQFVLNQEETLQPSSSEEKDNEKKLEQNIKIIKNCKNQTEKIVQELYRKIKHQNSLISQLQIQNQEERSKTKRYRQKYQEAYLSYKICQQQKQKYKRKFQTSQQKQKISDKQSISLFEQCSFMQRRYRDKICNIESFQQNRSLIDLISLGFEQTSAKRSNILVIDSQQECY